MRLYTFESNNGPALGAELDGQLVDLHVAYNVLSRRRFPEAGPIAALPADPRAFISFGQPALEAARQTLEFLCKRPAAPVGAQLAYPLEAVKLLSPLCGPGKIICARHDAQTCAWDYFLKLPETIVAPGEQVLEGREAALVLSQGFLALVVGKFIRPGGTVDAVQSVFGVTLLHHFFLTKPALGPGARALDENLDGSTALGPCIVTLDEFGAHPALEEGLRQLAITTRKLTLHPSDILAVQLQQAQEPASGKLGTLSLRGIGTLKNSVEPLGTRLRSV